MKITWKQLTATLAEHSSDDLLSEWRWLLGDSVQIVLISSLGDMFLKNAEGCILWLDAGAGRVTRIANSFEEFQELRQLPDHAAEWFVPLLVGDILEGGACLTDGQCFSYKLPPLVGGLMNLSNFEPTNLSVHFSILGQISREVINLPEGARIGHFSTTEANR